MLDDAVGVFDLIVTDPKFAGCLAGLTHAVIAIFIVEAMNVLHYIPPSGGPAPVRMFSAFTEDVIVTVPYIKFIFIQ